MRAELGGRVEAIERNNSRKDTLKGEKSLSPEERISSWAFWEKRGPKRGRNRTGR